MFAALFSTMLGISLTFYFGVHHFVIPKSTLFHAVLASNISAFVDITFITQTQNLPRLRAIFSSSILRTWFTLAVFYLGILLLLGPHWMLLGPAGLFLLFPLVLSAGISTLLFGPMQDALVGLRQRRNK